MKYESYEVTYSLYDIVYNSNNTAFLVHFEWHFVPNIHFRLYDIQCSVNMVQRVTLNGPKNAVLLELLR